MKFICLLVLQLFAEATSWACPISIDPERSLLVNDLAIVSNHRAGIKGPWNFATLLRRALGNHPNPGRIAYEWIKSFAEVRHYNGYDLPRRDIRPVLDAWPMGRVDAGVELRMNEHPFILSAIVFRPDLTRPGEGVFGEGRFIYSILSIDREPRDMTIIFEFEMKASPNLPSRRAWLKALAALSNIDRQSYPGALEQLTHELTFPRSGSSRLARIRTNEQLLGQGWDMREFAFNSRTEQLEHHSVEHTPDLSWDTDKSNALTEWINSRADDILAGSFVLPSQFRTASGMLFDDRFQWLNGNSEVDIEVKHAFRMQTCNGCHGRPTHTAFVHVAPREQGEVARLSDYLENQLQIRKEQLEEELCPST